MKKLSPTRSSGRLSVTRATLAVLARPRDLAAVHGGSVIMEYPHFTVACVRR